MAPFHQADGATSVHQGRHLPRVRHRRRGVAVGAALVLHAFPLQHERRASAPRPLGYARASTPPPHCPRVASPGDAHAHPRPPTSLRARSPTRSSPRAFVRSPPGGSAAYPSFWAALLARPRRLRRPRVTAPSRAFSAPSPTHSPFASHVPPLFHAPPLDRRPPTSRTLKILRRFHHGEHRARLCVHRPHATRPRRSGEARRKTRRRARARAARQFLLATTTATWELLSGAASLTVGCCTRVRTPAFSLSSRIALRPPLGRLCFVMVRGGRVSGTACGVAPSRSKHVVARGTLLVAAGEAQRSSSSSTTTTSVLARCRCTPPPRKSRPSPPPRPSPSPPPNPPTLCFQSSKLIGAPRHSPWATRPRRRASAAATAPPPRAAPCRAAARSVAAEPRIVAPLLLEDPGPTLQRRRSPTDPRSPRAPRRAPPSSPPPTSGLSFRFLSASARAQRRRRPVRPLVARHRGDARQ